MGHEDTLLTRQPIKIRRGGSRSCGKDKPYDELRRQTKLVIGLVQSTRLTKREIASILSIDYMKFNRFLKSLEADPFTRELLKTGLPGAYGETLPGGVKVRCIYCNHLLTAVPCVSCWPSDSVENSKQLSCQREVPEASGIHAKPGSPQKIEAMRARVANGFSPFSSQDTWCEPERVATQDENDLLFIEGEVDLLSSESLYNEFRARMLWWIYVK